MERVAIISDIHGNLHALQAVLSAIDSLDTDGMVCLGDVVGYGPFPEACLDLILAHCQVIVRGNHDEAAYDPREAATFNGAARSAIDWTRGRLDELQLGLLATLRHEVWVNSEVMCVHACPVPAPTDYVHDKVMASIAFEGVPLGVCLLGHTHVPLVFEAPLGPDSAEPQDIIAYVPADGRPLPLEPDRRYICNPGSVGQPRDADPRAAFAVLDLERRTFTLHRQEYDVDAAQAATQRAGLPTILAERLALGA